MACSTGASPPASRSSRTSRWARRSRACPRSPTMRGCSRWPPGSVPRRPRSGWPGCWRGPPTSCSSRARHRSPTSRRTSRCATSSSRRRRRRAQRPLSDSAGRGALGRVSPRGAHVGHDLVERALGRRDVVGGEVAPDRCRRVGDHGLDAVDEPTAVGGEPSVGEQMAVGEGAAGSDRRRGDAVADRRREAGGVDLAVELRGQPQGDPVGSVRPVPSRARRRIALSVFSVSPMSCGPNGVGMVGLRPRIVGATNDTGWRWLHQRSRSLRTWSHSAASPGNRRGC